MRTSRFSPFRIRFDRRIGAGKSHVFRQHHRQLIFGYRNGLTVGTINHRDRTTPITLAADAPVTQTEIHAQIAFRHRLQNVGNLVESLLEIQTIDGIGIHHSHVGVGFIGIPILPLVCIVAFVRYFNYLFDWQRVFMCEFEIALIMPRHRHDCASAVIHQYKVRDPDRYFFTANRMNGEYAGCTTFLFLRFQIGFGHTAAFAFVDECGKRRVCFRRFKCQRMFGGHRYIRYAHQSVGTCGENRQRFRTFDRELDFQAFTATNPVALHGFDRLRPTFERVQTIQQLLCVIGDFQEPLRNFALFYQRATAPAATVDHLLVGQHGVVNRIPVHYRIFAIDNALLEQAREHGLFVFVVVGLAGREFTCPVDGVTQCF